MNRFAVRAQPFLRQMGIRLYAIKNNFVSLWPVKH